MDTPTVVVVNGAEEHNPVEDMIRQAVCTVLDDTLNDRPRIEVHVHGADNAAYDDIHGMWTLRLDIKKAVRLALTEGAAIIRDENGNTVGSVVVGEEDNA